MRKIFMIFFGMLLSLSIFGEIKIKVIEPLKFTHVNTTDFKKDSALGRSLVEIYTDNREVDLGKRIIIEFPEKTFLTNRRKWIEAEKIFMEEKDRDFIMEKERYQIEIFALIDRNTLNLGEEVRDIEGEYVGYIPLIISQYVLENSLIETLPSDFPIDENMPSEESDENSSSGVDSENMEEISPPSSKQIETLPHTTSKEEA